MLETSDWPYNASFRKLVPDFAFFTPPARSELSVLLRPSLLFARVSSALLRMLLLLPGRRRSGLSAVRGGLGGGFAGALAGVEFRRLSVG